MSKFILWLVSHFTKISTTQAIIISVICALVVGIFVFGYLKDTPINDIANAAIKAETGLDIEAAQNKTDVSK